MTNINRTVSDFQSDPMKKKNPEGYWLMYQHKYPFQITVPHMTAEDPDPRLVQRYLNVDFLRVPFNGQSHWGFIAENHLRRFKKRYGVL